MMPSRWSLHARALLAIVLFIGFYALALGIALGLLYVPYAELVHANRVHLKLVLFAVVGAFLIPRAVMPRPDRFTAPGPRMTIETQPEILALLNQVARATGQRPPAEVYPLPDVNAFVTERGGVMGFGGRRVMGIGLPLIELLTVGELRAVIAHELGHFMGGDTRLGSWIDKTRAALGRTLDAVSGHSDLLAKPFEWYGEGFLRVTHAVSRAQEYVADAMAARVAGRGAARRALVRVEGGAGVYEAFWRSELAPILTHGFRPPLGVGLRRFMAVPCVVASMDALVDRALTQSATSAFDTHPSLRDRLEALERLPADGADAAPEAGDEAPASTLLADADDTEATLLASVSGRRTLSPVSWDDAPRVVLPMGWQDGIEHSGAMLDGLTPLRLPALLRDPSRFVNRLGLAEDAAAVRPDDFWRAAEVVGAAVALAVVARIGDSGPAALRLEAPLGEPVRAVVGERAIFPFTVCADLAAGRLSADAWLEWCREAGISDSDLGAVVRAPLSGAPTANRSFGNEAAIS